MLEETRQTIGEEIQSLQLQPTVTQSDTPERNQIVSEHV